MTAKTFTEKKHAFEEMNISHRPVDGYGQFLFICQNIIDQARRAREKEMAELEEKRHWLERRREELRAILENQVLRGDCQPCKSDN